MKITIRADSSSIIGSGHIMRCLNLAKALKGRGCEVSFLCQKNEGSLNDWLLKEQHFDVFELEETKTFEQERDADQSRKIIGNLKGLDWLIVDHYKIDQVWQRRLRDVAQKILVIDDLSDREHDCDAFLNQAVLDSKDNPHQDRVPESCVKFLGPRFALIDPQFLKRRQNMDPGKRSKQIQNIFSFFGGSDKDHFSLKFIEAVQNNKNRNLNYHLIVGRQTPGAEKILKEAGENDQIKTYHSIKDMAGFISTMDLFVGSGGMITWERCCLGVSGIVVSMADNQYHFSKTLGDQGCHVFLGRHQDINSKQLAEAIDALLLNSDQICNMSKKSFELVDGQGVDRIVRFLLEGELI